MNLKSYGVNYLSEKIQAVCNMLVELYDINDGGCAYLTYVIAEFLDKRGIKYEVIIYDSYHYNKMPDIDVVHVCLKIGNNIINNDSEFIKYTCSNVGYVTPSDINDYYNDNNWNRLYDIANNLFIKITFNTLLEHAGF